MLANRVKETTTTTGAGNITLAGAAANCQSFSAVAPVGIRFSYFVIDDTNEAWETGVGYLSDATTLVRETVQDNSSGTAAALTLAAGTKSVICAPNEMSLHPSYGPIGANVWLRSAHMTQGEGGSRTLAANKIYYTPHLHLGVGAIDALGVRCAAVAGTKMRLGIYSNKRAAPDLLLAQTADMVMVANTFVSASISPQRLPPGWYWLAVVSDGADGIGACASTAVTQSPMGVNADSFMFVKKYYEAAGGAGWSALPSAASGLSPIVNEALPQILGRMNV